MFRHELFLFSKRAMQYSRSLHIVSVAFPRVSASVPGVLWLFFPCADACQVFEWCSPHSWMLFRHSSGYVHVVICVYSTMLGAWIGRGLTHLNAALMPFTLLKATFREPFPNNILISPPSSCAGCCRASSARRTDEVTCFNSRWSWRAAWESQHLGGGGRRVRIQSHLPVKAWAHLLSVRLTAFKVGEAFLLQNIWTP